MVGSQKATLHDGYEIKESEDWGPLDDLVEWSGNKTDKQVVNQADSWIQANEFIDWWIFVTFSAAADSAGKNSYLAYDAATGQYVDMVKAGIIDPALVPHTALVNAASVAGLMLTTNVLVTELKDDEKPVEGALA